jgi:tetratricopeptide (TPR) repeat protein
MNLYRLQVMTGLCCGLALGAVQGAGMNSADQKQLADGLFGRGLHAMAVREYEVYLAGVTNDPRAAEAGFRLGECYRELGRTNEADGAFARVETEFPASPYRFRAGMRRAELLTSVGKPSDAAAVLTALLASEPPAELGAASLFMLGQSWEQAGLKAEAITAYNRLIKNHAALPISGYGQLALGVLYAADPATVAEAQARFKAAAENPPTPRVGAEAWFQLAEIHYHAKAYAAAAEAYEKLAAGYPADVRTHESRLQRAWATLYSGRPADVLRLADEALVPAVTNRPPEAGDEWLYLKANSLRQLLRFADAAGTYARLIAEYPTGRYAGPGAVEKALALFKGGAFREAISQARGLLNDVSNRRELLWVLAESHAALKEDNEAVQYYRMLVAQFPEAPMVVEARYRLARLLQQREDYLAAADLYDVIVKNAPADPLAAQALFSAAWCRGKANRPEDALRDWGQFVRQFNPHELREEALFQKAMTEIFLRRDTQARVTLDLLLADFPKTRFLADAHYWRGVLFDTAGRWADAEPALREALAARPATELEQKCRFQLALVLQKLKKTDESADLFQTLLTTPMNEKMPPDLLEWLAEHHLAKGVPAAAELSARLLTQRAGTDAWRQRGWFLVGRAALAQTQLTEAGEAFQKVLSLPGDTEAKAQSALELGHLALAGGNFPEARGRYEEAARLAADDTMIPLRARSYVGIARVLKQQGDDAGAARYFLSVAVLFDDPECVPECLYEAGELFGKLNRIEERDRAFRELAERYPDSRWNRIKQAP